MCTGRCQKNLPGMKSLFHPGRTFFCEGSIPAQLSSLNRLLNISFFRTHMRGPVEFNHLETSFFCVISLFATVFRLFVTIQPAELLRHPAMKNRFAMGRMPTGTMLSYGLCSECTDLVER